MDKNRAKTISIFVAFFAASYMSMAVYQNYFAIYYRHLGMSSVQIGVLSAIGPVVTMIVPIFFGAMADRSKYKNTVLSVVLFLATAASLLFFVNDSFVFVFFAVTLFFAAIGALIPLSDSIALDRGQSDGFKYAYIRLSGTLGFAVAALLVGYISDFNIMYAFYALTFVCAVAFVISLFLPKVKGYQKHSEPVSIFFLYKDKKYLAFQILSTLFWMNLGFGISFFGIYLTDVLGGTKTMLGYANISSILVEVVLLVTAMRIVKKLGYTNTLCLSAAILGIRWILTALSPGPWILIGVNVLHGMTAMVYGYVLANYVNDTVRPELRARGQMMNTMASTGLGRMVGSLLGGFIIKYLGYQLSYMISGIFCIAFAAAFFFIVKAIDKRREKSAA